MTKYKIYTVGFDLPCDDFESIPFDSNLTLLDADIILFEPDLGHFGTDGSFEGQELLDEYYSFRVTERLAHWRAEIDTAVGAGKLVVVFLATPVKVYRHTGRREYSGTGRNARTTNIVTVVTSYEAVPYLTSALPKTGKNISLLKEAEFLKPYWSDFSEFSIYETEITGQFDKILLQSKSGNRILGAELRSGNGCILYLPPLRFDEGKYAKFNDKTGELDWTAEARKLGARLAAHMVGLIDHLRSDAASTPRPSWESDGAFVLPQETALRSKLEELDSRISALQGRHAELCAEVIAAGSLRRLLYEQGAALEKAILEAVTLLGFQAEPYQRATSEFDCVFISPEGRCLGEAEGKDSKPINVDKIRQLVTNLQEDFAREDVSEMAKGVLFGNAQRLLVPTDRVEFFTAKCVQIAKQSNIALVRTIDLFEAARYLQTNPEDGDFARSCRAVIFASNGIRVVFPKPPSQAGAS